MQTNFFDQIARCMAQDPGGRGLAARVPPPDLDGVAQLLQNPGPAIITTGFPVLPVEAGETDGPGGGANIARLLGDLGREVTIVTDSLSYEMILAACKLHAPAAQVVCVPFDGAEAFCEDLLRRLSPSLVIAIERPGRHGAHYHNMRGLVLDGLVADTDRLFSAFDGPTMAIGDGGNELGMGSFTDLIVRHVSGGEKICADLGADYPLVAGISNWWAWGLQALMSLVTGRELLSSREAEWQMLQAVLSAGGVDGVSHRSEPTVDGLDFDHYTAVLEELRTLVAAGLAEREAIYA